MRWTKKDEEEILGKNWRRDNPQEKYRCQGCFHDFWRDQREVWKVLCNSCWEHSPVAKRETRDKITALLAERDLVTAQLDDLKREREELLRAKEELMREREAFEMSILRHYALEPPAPCDLPGEMLARLIRLCQPDRHNNSEASNLATAWLLAQRT